MDINQILTETPSILARKAEQAEQLRLEWQQALEHYDHKEAQYVMTLKATLEGVKATEIKFYIKNDSNLYKLRLDLVLLESNYRKAEAEINALNEELRSAKMMARIRISEWESQIELKGGSHGMGK